MFFLGCTWGNRSTCPLRGGGDFLWLLQSSGFCFHSVSRRPDRSAPVAVVSLDLTHPRARFERGGAPLSPAEEEEEGRISQARLHALQKKKKKNKKKKRKRKKRKRPREPARKEGRKEGAEPAGLPPGWLPFGGGGGGVSMRAEKEREKRGETQTETDHILLASCPNRRLHMWAGLRLGSWGVGWTRIWLQGSSGLCAAPNCPLDSLSACMMASLRSSASTST